MKKHSWWRSNRRAMKVMRKQVRAIERRDDEVAQYFDLHIALAKSERERGANASLLMPEFFYLHMPRVHDWPELTDHYIEVKNDEKVPDGIYYAREVSYRGVYDVLLTVWNLKTQEDHFLWFPRADSRVISVTELQEREEWKRY